MNWFERYGIVGFFFVVCLVAWDASLYRCGWARQIQDFKELAVLMGAAALPCGYLVAVTSQLLYYLLPHPFRIHSRVWKKVVRESRSEIYAEAAMTVCIRGGVDPTNVAREQWVQGFTSRRWDVFAINNSIMAAVIVSLIAVIGSEGLEFQLADAAKFAFIVAGIILMCCLGSCCIMARQIRLTLSGCYSKMLRQQKPRP